MGARDLLERRRQRLPVLELAQLDDRETVQLRLLPPHQPRERGVRADDPALGVEHGLADRSRLERAAEQRLGSLQRAAARLELGEHRHLGPEQVGVERLQHVVNRPDAVPAGDLRHLVARRRQEHDRDVACARALLDQLRGLEPVEARHAHVEQDHREVLLEQHAQRSVPRGRRPQRIAERIEHRLERPQILGLVVDEQDRQRLDCGQVQHAFGVGERGGGGWLGVPQITA